MAAANVDLSCLRGNDVFQTLQEDFLTQIKFAAIRGEYGSSVLVITKNDDVYYKHQDKKVFDKVQPFCGPVKRVFQSWMQFLVLSKEHKLFLSSNSFFSKSISFSAICPEYDIKQVSFGYHHGTLLTNDRKILTFMLDNTENMEAHPTEGPTKWSSVTCGGCFTSSIDTDSKLYVWWPRLLSGRIEEANVKTKFTDKLSCSVPILNDVKQVACGLWHVLALTPAGTMYSFGGNEKGQLGLGHTLRQNLPVKIEVEEKVTEIGCSIFSKTSSCLTESNKVFVWGEYKEQELLHPTHLPEFSSLRELFNSFKQTVIAMEPIEKDEDETEASDLEDPNAWTCQII